MKKFFKLLTSKLFLAFLFFLLQIAVIVIGIMILKSQWPKANFWIGLGFTVISGLVAFFIVSKDANAGYKLIWIFIILLFPLFGGILYLALGRKTTRKKFSERLKSIDADTQSILELTKEVVGSDDLEPTNMKIRNYILNTSRYPIYKNTETKYYKDIESTHEDILIELKNAKKYIFLEFFIIERGEFFDSIAEVLKAKAAEGVDVRLIYDDIGCLSRVPNNFNRKLDEIGIKTKVFNRLRASINANNRTHRKIIVIDGKVSFTGGFNLADEYINIKSPFGHWKDTAIKLTGEASWSFTIMFMRFWQMLTKPETELEFYVPEEYIPSNINPEHPNINGYVQPLAGGPDSTNPLLKNTFIQIINNAKDYVYINTPYLILDDETINALNFAARSGVDVRITMPGKPDKITAYAMSHAFYPRLLKNGVKIYEYTPGFNHAKSIVSDDHTAYIGSCNFDYRSFYLHYECGVVLYDTPSIKDLKEDYLQVLEECEQATFEKYGKVNPFMRFWRAVLRFFAPLF